MVGNDGHFLCEAIHMRSLAFEIGQGNEQREIAIVVPGFLDAIVEQALNTLPNTIAPGLDDHAPADTRFLGQVGGGDDFLIPGGEIVFALDGQRMANVGHVLRTFQ